MQHLTADDILADLEYFPRTMCLPLRYNNLGSPYVAFAARPEVVDALVKHPVINAFRRVVLDPVRGFILLMAPSAEHESLAVHISDVVRIAASVLNLDSEDLRATRWRRRGDQENTGIEPDSCFYLGDNAVNYLNAIDKGQSEEFIDVHPPDLVVEVTVSHFDNEKQVAYQERGVPEYWQIKAQRNALPEVDFIDLQTNNSPRLLSTSKALPGLTVAAVQDCLQARRRARPRDYALAIRQALSEHGTVPVRRDGQDTPQ